MRSRGLLAVLALVIAMLACNLPSNAPVTETPTLASFTPSPTLSLLNTPTILPSNTPPATAISTPTVPVASPKEVAVNCRLGPGTGWVVLSGLNVGQSSQIAGKSGDGGWWYIVDPFNSARKCWVATSVTSTAGNLAGIPVAEAPKAEVTEVTINVNPNAITATACPGASQPLELKATIETNGPTTVTWHFETQQTGALTTNTTDFASFGSLDISTNYTAMLGTGTYWVRIIVTSPNAMQAEAKYTITCP